eukprot:g8356.t1
MAETDHKKRMLIDAAHPEEKRIAIIKDDVLEEFDCEVRAKRQLKGNIYLAQVIRVEPSLQAAFLEFGGNKHGFLAFNEIHPDYYQIPVEDQQKLLDSLSETSEDEANKEIPKEEKGEGQEDVEETPTIKLKPKAIKPYKIQEVIKRRQVMLVCVVKDERIIRGSRDRRAGKGAALSTYISLPGRYGVLMPNTPQGGGVSRKIADLKDRKRLREITESLEIPKNMGLIIRTAGMGRTKLEIKRDYEYLMRVWENIKDLTLQSKAPQLIYESGDLVTRAIRDFYTREIDEVLVEGEEGYKKAKQLMRMMMPSHSKRVQSYKDTHIPLYQKYNVEEKIDSIHDATVHLPSGGSIVFSQTEALVAIDVNSGRSTKERNIEETALKTNFEAATEIARQLCLRDLSGLIVVDFIDMDGSKMIQKDGQRVSKHNLLVERRLKEAMANDRARTQIGTISQFGLLEMSRQRLRLSFAEVSSTQCHYCRGTGIVRSVESSVLRVLRALEKEGIEGTSTEITLYVPDGVALYILNHKREAISALEKLYNMRIWIMQDPGLVPPDFRMSHVRRQTITSEEQEKNKGKQTAEEGVETSPEPTSTEGEEEKEIKKSPSRNRRRRRKRAAASTDKEQPALESQEGGSPPSESGTQDTVPEQEGGQHKKDPVQDTNPPSDKGEAPARKNGHRRRRSRSRPPREKTETTETNVVSLAPNPSHESATEQGEGTSDKGDKKGWWQRLLES